MNRLLFLWTLICISSSLAPPVYSQESMPNALLWEISGGELESPSYLYGTIHMIAREDFYMGDPLKEAIESADKVVFEINLESMNDMSTMMGMFMNFFMANDTTLSDLLEPEEYGQVKTYFEDMGLPMFVLNKIKPMFLSIIASSDFNLSEGMPVADQSTVSYEMEIMNHAKSFEKSFDGLETVAFQMSMFDSIPYGIQAKMLVETVQGEGGSDESQLDTLVQLYKAQDLNGMASLFKADESGLGYYEDLLLNKRNLNWIPIMKRMMGEGTTLFAVGAGHLVGEKGVVNLLKEQGYTLKPVPFSWPDN